MANIPEYEKENSLALSMGWDLVKDEGRGYCYGCMWCKFTKGDEWVWSTYPTWTRAKLVDDYFVNHIRYKSLLDALCGESKR